MKFALFGFLLLGIFACVPAYENAPPIPLQSNKRLTGIADIISGLIKSVFETLRKAIPEPLEISKIAMNSNSTAMNGSFEIDELLETGLKRFDIVAANVSVFHSTLNLTINIPRININANYFTDLLFGTIVPMYGSGPFNIHLRDLQLDLTSKYTFKILKAQLALKNTTLITTLSNATFDIHGVINNEAFSILISQIFDDTFKEFIDRHTQLISEIISPIVETVLNSILNTKKKTTTAPPPEPTTEGISSDATDVTEDDSSEEPITAVPDLADFDFAEMIDTDQIKELGRLFVKNLKNHPEVSKLFAF